jgi:hypothetical protein
VLGVGISSPFAGHHWRMARGGRRWSVTNFWISSSSIEEVLNISGREAVIHANEKDSWEQKCESENGSYSESGSWRKNGDES